MRKLIDYIRSCFCKHEWELLSHDIAQYSKYTWETKQEKWAYRCKKCGYFKVHKNY